MKMKNRKKFVMLCVACGLIAAMSIGGTLAYLTDQTEATNNFTFGDVKVDTIETEWNTTDSNNNGVPDMAENGVPNQQIPKSVQARNVGINDAIVFVKLTVPVENVTRVFDNGRVETTSTGAHDKKKQEIFYFQNSGYGINYQNNGFEHDGRWVNLPEEETGYNGAGGSTPYLDMSPNKFRAYTGTTRTYVFGYNARLTPGAITSTLFEKVQIKNFLENEITPRAIKNIKVETYSIQADNIVNSSGQIGTSRTISRYTLKEIYDIYVNQNPSYR